MTPSSSSSLAARISSAGSIERDRPQHHTESSAMLAGTEKGLNVFVKLLVRALPFGPREIDNSLPQLIDVVFLNCHSINFSADGQQKLAAGVGEVLARAFALKNSN